MYPDSDYAVPVPSFRNPVPLVTVDPQAEPLVFIGLNCDWFPVILGALKQLLLQSTWDTTDPDALNLVQARVFSLMAAFDCARLPTLAELQGVQGGGCEEDCMCCLRVVNGMLQQLSCGVWTDVPGQPPGGFYASQQPGSGSSQPPAGGGCAQYHATLPGNGQWLLPTVVSTGDTIALSGLTGVFYEGGSALWYCPDGFEFFAGLCTGVTVTNGGSQMPAVPVGRVIAEIDGTYYDVQGGVFTVPGGVSNKQVTFVQNSSNLSGSAGSVGFDVEVCNNQAAQWTSIFDFTINPYTSLFSFTFGNWSPSIGYDGQPGTGQNSTVVLELPVSGQTIVSAQLTYSSDGNAGPGDVVYVDTNSGPITTHNPPAVGTNINLVGAATYTGVTNIEVAIGDGTGGTFVHISKLIISGLGTKPVGWP